MNILIFTAHPPIPNGGGVSRMAYTISKLLQERSHKVYYLSNETDINSIDVPNQFFFPSQDPNSQDNLRFLEDFIRTEKIGCIINHIPINPYSNILYKANRGNCKLISILHNAALNHVSNFAYKYQYRLKKRKWLFDILRLKLVKRIVEVLYISKYRSIYRNIEKSCNQVVIVSPSNRKEVDRMLGYKSPKITCIPNFIHVIDNDISQKENVVVWCGRLETELKRVDLMLDIWAKVCNRHPDWKLIIMGRGCIDEMKQYAKNIEARNIEFVGNVNTRPYYRRASILCHTSLSESFGLVLVEAMNWGCVPVVFDSFPACRDLIPSDCGYRIKAFDIEEYANKLSSLIDNEMERYTRSTRCKEFSSQYNEENSINEWIRIIEK